MIQTNERELASKIAHWFSEYLAEREYPFRSASVEPSIKVGKSTYFADIIIWADEQETIPFSYIELKKPHGEPENLERFAGKAQALKVKIAYTWNFQTLNAYKIRDSKMDLIDSESYLIFADIQDWKRADIQIKIRKYVQKIIDELLQISKTGKFLKFKPEKHYFIDFLRNSVKRLLPSFEFQVHSMYHRKEFKPVISKYAAEQAIYYSTEDEFFRIIASQRVYGLVTRIIFYLTIKRYFSDLPDIYTSETKLEESLAFAFKCACDKDWQAVFQRIPMDELGIPQDSEEILTELLTELAVYDFNQVPEDVIGELFEELIEPESRHTLGQYFTREDLVDFVIATIVNDASHTYADPTCGSGTFLMRLYSRLKYLDRQIRHTELLDRIWGIDIGKFPAELSTINLFRQNPADFNNFPRILHADLFTVNTGDIIEFPPPNAGKNYIKANVKVPSFNGLVGNFPFIRQELIEKKVPGYKKELTKAIARHFFTSYPALFSIKNANLKVELQYMADQGLSPNFSWISGHIENGNIELNLSGQADIYAYLMIYATSLLSNNGCMAIITSNSWMDVAYGTILKQFLLDHFKIKMIVGSWAEPWFDDVAVNTVFTVLERCNDPEKRETNQVMFIKVKKGLKEILRHEDLTISDLNRWNNLEGIIRNIEHSYEHSREIVPLIHAFEDKNFRIRHIRQDYLENELKSQKELSKWSKYLRAPDIYFEIIEKCTDKLVPLKRIADIKRGITTGINDFFYLKPHEIENEYISEKPSAEYLAPGIRVICSNSRGWKGEIESCYLKKIIKSPKESEFIIIDPEKLKFFLFYCDKTKKELKKLQHYGALSYIEWGEKQRTKDNVLWPKVPSVASRKNWYSFELNEFADFLWPKSFNDRFSIFFNNKVLAADRFYEIILTNKEYIDILKISLNSTIQALLIENNSRINLGDGVLDNMTYEAENALVINPKLLISSKVFTKLLKKRIQSTGKGWSSDDRKEIDRIILTILGLDPQEDLQSIDNTLRTLVSERLTLPKMRRRKTQEKILIAYDQIKESVIQACIGKKGKRFPESFFSGGVEGMSYKTVKTEDSSQQCVPGFMKTQNS